MQVLSSLDSSLTRDVPPGAPAMAWRARLSRVGLLRPVDLPDGGWSPQSGMADVQRALAELEAAEAALAEAQAKNPLAKVQLPPLLWGVVGAILIGILLFAEVAVAYLGPWAIWGGIGFAVVVAGWTVVERKLVDPSLKPRLKAAQQALRAALDALVARDFVAVVGPDLLLSTPTLDRLRGMADALRSADPDALILTGMQAEIDVTQARLDGHLAAQTAPWTDAGLSPDIDRWQREIDALG